MTQYAVYFEQVNQTRFLIEAECEDEAIQKAAKEWKAEFGCPMCIDMEDYGEPRQSNTSRETKEKTLLQIPEI